MLLPLLPFERIAKKSGIKRIAKDALQEAREIISDEAAEIAENAVKFSKHAKRKTVMKDDIVLAARN